MNDWIDILWDANDGLPVDDPNHIWGATGCTSDQLEHVCECINRDYPDALISLFSDSFGLREHLAETGRSL